MTSPVRPVDLDVVPTGPVPVVLSLGSNLGDSAATLTSAVAALHEVGSLTVERVSPVVQTAPVGGPDQGDYLNAVVLAVTTLSPHQLLAAIHVVEAAHGRTRETRWGARTLDIDMIDFDSLVCVGERLELPHPRAHERAFVLVPWAAADPDAVLPGPRGGPVVELAATAGDAAGVRATAVRIR